MRLNQPTHSLTYGHYVDNKHVKFTQIHIHCTSNAIAANPGLSYEQLGEQITARVAVDGENIRCEHRQSLAFMDPNYLIVRDGVDGAEFLDITSIYKDHGAKWIPINFETMTNEEQNSVYSTYGCISEKYCKQLVSGQLSDEHSVNLRVVPIGYHEVYVSECVPYAIWDRKHCPSL